MTSSVDVALPEVPRRWRGRALIALFAICIGLLTAGPALYFHFFDAGYRGIELFGSDAEEVYLAEVGELYEGNTDLGNPYLVDHKSDPYVRQPLSPLIVATFAHLLGMTVAETNLLTKLLFPALLSVLVFLFFRDVFGRPSYATLATLFVMLAPATLTFLTPAAWPAFFLDGEFLYSNFKFLAFARPINPQVSFLFFFGYLLCTWRFLFVEQEKRTRLIYAIAASVILGLSLYTYFFAVSYALVWTGLLFLWMLWKKEWRPAGGLALIVGGAFLIGIPYFLNTFEMMQSPVYADLAGRLGVAYNRVPVISKVLVGVLLLVAAFIKRLPKKGALFLVTSLLTGLIVTNQQLITGQTVPIPDHYYWYFIQPFSGIALLFIFLTLLERFLPKLMGVAVVCIAIFFAGVGIAFQTESYLVQRPGHVAKQEYKPIIDLLAAELPSGLTVLSDNTLANLLPVYTDLNLYQMMGMGDFLVSRERLQHTYFVHLFLKGVPTAGIREYLEEHREEAGGWIFSQTYHAAAGCFGCFPQEVLEDIAAGYEAFTKKDFLTELKRYPLDYIVWNKTKEPTWHLERYFTKPTYQFDSVDVYEVR